MARKNYSAYRQRDWLEASGTLRQILSNGWPVYADCDLCGLRLKADLDAMSRRIGGQRSLWGFKPNCRRVGCVGRVTFYLDPPGATIPIAMTAPPR